VKCVAVLPARLLPGDYVFSGLRGLVGALARIEHAQSPNEYVITFTDGRKTVAHKSTFVHIKRNTP
jgi:hypothetical protein